MAAQAAIHAGPCSHHSQCVVDARLRGHGGGEPSGRRRTRAPPVV